MKTMEIMNSMLMELGKLVIRSDENTMSLVEGALKFVELNLPSFSDPERLSQRIQSLSLLEKIYPDLYERYSPENQEPCYLPFTLMPNSDPSFCTGFLAHIFKGEQEILPLPIKEIVLGAKQYHRILYTMKHDLKRLNCVLDIETWLHLLERYTKWIPASNSLQHISLYQYIRFKMALAACVDEQNIEKSPLALFALEIQGKEKFFCSISPGDDLNGFKGAAYYFQSLKESLMRDFLQAADLPLCNALIQESSRFVLLVNQESKKNLFQKALKHEEFLCQQHAGKLSLSVHFEPVSLDDLKEKNFSFFLANLYQELDSKSKEIISSLLQNSPQNHSFLFGPYEKNLQQENEFHKSLQALGKQLTETRWITKEKASVSKELPISWEKMPLYFGKKEILWKENPELKEPGDVYRFANTDFFSYSGKGYIFSEVIPYLMAEGDVPYKDRWCFIHGKIDPFQTKEFPSPASFLTLYDHLQNFFNTYLLSLLREKKYRKCMYMAYLESHSFIMACSPQIALCLISQIHKKFCQFVSNQHTMSASISLLDTEYPFEKALYLEFEKNLENQQNCVYLLDQSIHWPFLESIQKAQEKLSIISKGKGKHFLSQLWSISDFFQKKEKNKKNLTLWRHLIHYYFNKIGIVDSFDKYILESERGPAYLNTALEWNALMSTDETL
ncbi:MAG: hypothetical protein HUU50_11705 [Candidatus Brocadiae bacterium]|nr:hypothetical protein [Candidatus Brocadiia bacterium]